MSIVYTIVLIQFSILIHEMGHIITGRLVGYQINSLSLGSGPYIVTVAYGDFECNFHLIPIGGKVSTTKDIYYLSPRNQILIFSGGALFNFIATIIGICFVYGFGGTLFHNPSPLVAFVILNIAGIGNLIPVRTSDGDSILKAIRASR